MQYLSFSLLKCCLSASLFLILIGCNAEDSDNQNKLAQLPNQIDFNFHVKPILSDRCFSCHGPDEAAREADLRLDLEEHAFAAMDSQGERFAIVPGNPVESELIRRITHSDPEQLMPPPESNRFLTAYEIEILKRWIEQGAVYKAHWAFIPPVKSQPPVVENEDWCSNAIDYFILKKLEEKGMRPHSSAEKEILLRRLTLDLTGLPPTIEEIDDFLRDDKPNAYEKVVDRLLNSPHFGERMALFWLDIARYADSHGYSQDGLRIMWPWRDWVIKAFNDNMPYDQFISWQIAGDKFPNAEQEQKLATGFLRNHRLNGEGGIVDEEYRIEYAADRTETTATAFLGLTMQCARCHDHKFDPISQEEYYQFFGFFNSVHESGKAANDGNSGPEVVLTPRAVEARISALERMIEAEKKKAEKIEEELSETDWQTPVLDLENGKRVDLTFDQMTQNAFRNKAGSHGLFGVRGEPEQLEGAKGNAIKFTAFNYVNISDKNLDFDRSDAFSFSFFLKSDQDSLFTSVLNHLGSAAINYPGYEIALIDGYLTFRMAHSLPANLIAVRSARPIKKGEWTHYTFTYDGSGEASGIGLFRNGEKEALTILYDKLTQGFANGKSTLTVGGKIGYQTEVDGYGFIDELKIFDRQLSGIEAHALFHGREGQLREMQEKDRKEHFLLTQHADYRAIVHNIQLLRQQIFYTQDTLVSAMVMEDMPQAKPARILARGVYNAPGKQVYPATPKAVLPFAIGARPDRLGLSAWMLDYRNPLTARVAVNHFWQLIFGQGLVKTAEDFGNQGALPSHPALLDYLAVHFMESGWNVKALLKMMVLSATYRQSSRVSLEVRNHDPDNIFLARGPHRRLSAELIRDCALAASGLLVKQIGGPSVKPYQPQGLWREKGEFSKLKNYVQDTGDYLYRRSLYTFWRRTSPPPSMVVFDAPSREICIVSRQETNTPLQVLVLQNDPQFVESARILAEKVMRSETNRSAQIVQAYRCLTGLHPKPEVVGHLEELEKQERLKYERQQHMALQLMQVGEYPADTTLNVVDVAAMTIVCSTIMNTDETLVKR